MSEFEFIDDRFPKHVSVRNSLALWVTNKFPYIMVLPVVAVTLGLHLDFIWSAVSILVGLGLVLVFWKLYSLELPVAETTHPHHTLWKRSNAIARPFAVWLQTKKPWHLVLIIFWVTATIANLAAARYQGEQYLISQFWLMYIPVVIWPSYKLKEKSTEWFVISWLLSALTYLAATIFFLPGFMHNPVVLSDFFSHIIWFGFLSCFLHYLFRRLASFRGEADSLQKIIEILREDRAFSEAFDTHPLTSTPDEHLSQVAQMIGSMLKYERVFIHIRDAQKNQLFMKGRYGADGMPWPEMGWSIEQQNSITGWVAAQKKAHLCNDTKNCTLFYDQDKNSHCKSEVAVPIIVETECVGVIELESSIKMAFDNWDVQLLWQLANSIGAALGYERHVSKEVQAAYQLLEDTALKMASSRSLDEALEQVAKYARSLFKADLVTIYKHAVSTCVPLPGLIVEGQANYPLLLGNHIPGNSRVNELRQIKEDVYIQSFSDEDDLLLGPNHGECSPEDAAVLGNPYRFVRREKIKSTVYIKLGLGEEIVGSLFLNFRQRTFFQKQQVNALRSFAKTLAMALILKRRVERVSGPLAGTTPLTHSQAEAAFESVSRKFNEIRLSDLADCAKGEQVLKQLEDFSGKLEHLKREWTNLILVEQSNLHGSSLVEPITHLETKLKAMFPTVRLKWNWQDFLSIPIDELGEVLYKIIAESVSNALVHARATEIELKSWVKHDQIQLSITNNGISIGLEKAMMMNEMLVRVFRIEDLDKDTGIIPILMDARRWFGAAWEIAPLPGAGTSILVRFPLGNTYNLLEDE